MAINVRIECTIVHGASVVFAGSDEKLQSIPYFYSFD
jgi:hypothetical protein